MPLYCEKHTVAIYDRGGTRLVGNLESLTRVHWERVRDAVSVAAVTVSQPSQGCFQLLNEISCNRHELVIFRGKDRVWEGPITHIERKADVFTVSARDVMHYAYRTAMHNEYDSAAYWSPDAKDPDRVWVDNTELTVDRVVNILQTELNRKKETLSPPVNVVPYITPIRAATLSEERSTNRRTAAFSMTVYDEMESLAQYGGLDYTVVGRRIVIKDNRVPLAMTAPVTEKDFLSEIIVTSYGMESYTRNFASGDQGLYGVYPPLGGTGDLTPEEIAAADYYGEWENVEQMMDADSTEPPSQNDLDYAARIGMSSALPVPTRVRIPENSQLNPNGTLSIQDLVPGVIIPVRATLTSIVLVQNQKLDSVAVDETGESGESITVSLGPPPNTLLERAS